MISVVSFKLEATPKQKRILNRYFETYYHFYQEAMKIVQKQMQAMYHSESWIEANDMVRSVVMAEEFKPFLKAKKVESKTGNLSYNYPVYSLEQVRQYILRKNEECHDKTNNQLRANEKFKKSDLEKENRRQETIKQSVLKMEQGDFDEKNYREYLSKLKTIKFGVLNSYHLNGGAGVILENSIRFLLKDLTNKYKKTCNMYTSTVGEIIIQKMIAPSILTIFDKKIDNPRSRRLGQYIIPHCKKMREFNTIQCGQFRGGDGATTPFKIDFENNSAVFYFPRRDDNKSKGLKGKEKHSIKIKNYDDYREKLIEKNRVSDQLYVKTKDKCHWFFKYPTLVQKMNRSGAISYELQITYNGSPSIEKKVGKGITGVSLSSSTVAIWSLNPKGVRGVQSLYPAFYDKKTYLASGQVFNELKENVRKSQKYFLASGQPITIQEAQKEFQRIQSQIEYEENKEIMEKVVRFDERENAIAKISYHYKRGQKSKKIRTPRYYRARNRAVGLMKANCRGRKQYYNSLANSILEAANEVHIARGRGDFSESLIASSDKETDLQKNSKAYQEMKNFASSDFELILKNKLRNCEKEDKYYLLSDEEISMIDTSNINCLVENYGIKSLVQSNLYHAFLLAHTQVNIGRRKMKKLDYETGFTKEEWLEFVRWSRKESCLRSFTIIEISK